MDNDLISMQPVNGLGAGHPVEGNFGRGEGGLPAQVGLVEQDILRITLLL